MSTDTDFERILRADLHAAADDLVVPLTVDEVLDVAARARTGQRLLRVGLVVIAVLVAGVLWWATGLGAPGNRAVPDPLQRPTATAPTASAASPSSTPVETLLTVAPPEGLLPGEPSLVRASLRADGRTVDVAATNGEGPIGPTRALELPEGDNVVFASGFPREGYVVGLLRADATWVEAVQPGPTEVLWDWAASGLEGTDLQVVAIRFREASDQRLPELLWADQAQKVRDSQGREAPSAVFDGPGGQERTLFVDDRLGVAGVVSPAPDGSQSLIRTSRSSTRTGSGVRFQMVVAETTERRYFVGGILPAGSTGLTAVTDADVAVVMPLATAPASVGDDLLFYGEWTSEPGEQLPQPVSVSYTDAAGVDHDLPVWDR